MADLELNFQSDVDAVQRIPIIEEMLNMICNATGMGFAAVARVTPERWITCASYDKLNFGLVPGAELPVESTLCHEIRQNHQVVVFDNVDEEPDYADHHTPRIYGLKSYISVPLFLRNGDFFGTLCAIDPKPAHIKNQETIAMFRFYADLISFHYDAVTKLEQSESRLKEERELSELREQFIAILGHDLRNPVGAVQNVAQIMLRMNADERIQRLGRILQDSSLRMREMIENILDFARGRLGEGIILNISDEAIADHLDLIIAEHQLIRPDSQIDKSYNLEGALRVDGRRIAQLFSNLLGNALTHGSKDQPVLVTASNSEGIFRLSVSNAGEPIADNLIPILFKPFSRGAIKPGQQGLGLGLHIASEIAKAHGGTLIVSSNVNATCFTLELPMAVSPGKV